VALIADSHGERKLAPLGNTQSAGLPAGKQAPPGCFFIVFPLGSHHSVPQPSKKRKDPPAAAKPKETRVEKRSARAELEAKLKDMQVIGRVVFRCLVCPKDRVGKLKALRNHLKSKRHALRLSTDKAWTAMWLLYAEQIRSRREKRQKTAAERKSGSVKAGGKGTGRERENPRRKPSQF